MILKMEALLETPSTPLSQTHIDTLQNHSINLNNYYRPSELEINTVGSYLWGCSQNYYGDVNKSCSPLCINSLFSKETDCQYSVWTYSSNQLKNILNVQTSKAYIYVEKDWTGFLNSDIENLKTYGISHATILKTQNSQHKIILPMISINNLPVIKNYFQEYELKEGGNYYWLVILIILAIVLFLNFK